MGPGRDSRYSGPEGHWGLLEGVGAILGVSGGIRGVGCQRCIGADRDCRYSGTRRGIGASGGIGNSYGCRGAILEVSGTQGV